MNANSINSISEFLLHAGTEYIVFDMGRRLTALDNQAFLDIENGSTVAPFPRQQHAWFGIVFFGIKIAQISTIFGLSNSL